MVPLSADASMWVEEVWVPVLMALGKIHWRLVPWGVSGDGNLKMQLTVRSWGIVDSCMAEKPSLLLLALALVCLLLLLLSGRKLQELWPLHQAVHLQMQRLVSRLLSLLLSSPEFDELPQDELLPHW
jgi:hypothetical protein